MVLMCDHSTAHNHKQLGLSVEPCIHVVKINTEIEVIPAEMAWYYKVPAILSFGIEM